MSKRMDAIWRIVALVWSYVVGTILMAAASLVGLVYMIADVLWQLILGSEGLSASSFLGSWIRGIIMWVAGQTSYALVGDGEFKLLPSAA